MVTWLKKFRYSYAVKFIVIMGFLVSAFFVFNSLVGLIRMPKEESFYKTREFMFRVTSKAGFVRDWIVRYADEAIFDPHKVTQEQIDVYRQIMSNEQDKGSTHIVIDAQTDQSIAQEYAAEPDRVHTGTESDKKIIEKIIEDRKNYFTNIQKELLEDNYNIEFLAVNKNTGKIITNIPNYKAKDIKTLKEELSGREAYLIGNGSSIQKASWITEDFYYSYDENYYKGEPFNGENNYEIYVAVKEKLQTGDWFYNSKQEFDKQIAVKNTVYLWGGLGIGLGIILLLIWISIVGQSEKGGAVRLSLFDKIPFEIQFIGYCIGMLLWVAITGRLFGNRPPKDWLPYTFNSRYILEEIILNLFVSMGVLMTLLIMSSIIKHIKNKSMKKYIGIIRMTAWVIQHLITEKALPMAVFITIGGYLFINFFSVVITFILGSKVGALWILGGLWLIGFNLAAAFGLFKIVLDYLKLHKGAKQIVKGHLKEKIKLSYGLPVMNEMADTINHIGEGLEQAVEHSLKSERLKTELITNVSHDLKTPLTSIISYIDLLKEEPIDNEEAKEYIQILAERSNRLKQLVEDLVEASKAVTGNVKANLAPVELGQLTQQAVGEYTDRLEESGLTIMMEKTEEVYILADNRHIYRILENLLSNVQKHAMPHTRVYIEVVKEAGYGKLIIKNISKESLNIHPSELTKRFVRGDQARSTEGSGLGLAIAQSLVRLQGGTFANTIDGDLFKVEISIPCC